MDIEILKAEHSTLVELRQQLLALVNGEGHSAAEMATLRWRLSRVLLAHLAKEDSHLYPRLKADAHAPTAVLAQRYEQEMGDLAARWQAFMADWPSDRIARERAGFCKATRAILDTLSARIQREERDLYPRYAASTAAGAALTSRG